MRELGLDPKDVTYVHSREASEYQVTGVMAHDICQLAVGIVAICSRNPRGRRCANSVWRRWRVYCGQNWPMLGYLCLFLSESRAVSAVTVSAETELDVLVLDQVGFQLGPTYELQYLRWAGLGWHAETARPFGVNAYSLPNCFPGQ